MFLLLEYQWEVQETSNMKCDTTLPEHLRTPQFKESKTEQNNYKNCEIKFTG
jgi:hypothetical protein